jgi:hypothetical protein
MLAMHFSSNEYKICIRLYHEIMELNEKKILNERGFRLELILYTEIYGAIFHYENDDVDFAYYLVAKIKKKYSTVLNRQEAKREKQFVTIFEKMLNDSSYMDSTRFVLDCNVFNELKDFVPGDYEYISLNAWLLSKVKGRKYYECFLELVN